MLRWPMTRSDPIDAAIEDAQVKRINDELGRICSQYERVTIITGAARGADTRAGEFAKRNGYELIEYPVTSRDWGKYGKAAGALRNIKMLKEQDPDLVVAFPGGNGTNHMVSIARAAKKEVIQID